ncbi:IS5/IS1182 family transposase, partial [Streptomyces decoyicus]
MGPPPAREVRELERARNRLRMRAAGGTWERVFTALMARDDADQDLNRAVSVDAAILRAHQRTAGARTQGA